MTAWRASFSDNNFLDAKSNNLMYKHCRRLHVDVRTALQIGNIPGTDAVTDHAVEAVLLLLHAHRFYHMNYIYMYIVTR